MLTPSLYTAEIALYDIDGDRLKESKVMLDALNKNINMGRATIKTYCGVENRKEALRGADFVVNAIQVGGYDPCTITDFEIPKKIWLKPNHCRHYGNWRNYARTAYYSGIRRVCR